MGEDMFGVDCVLKNKILKDITVLLIYYSKCSGIINDYSSYQGSGKF
jgi:hypothetical protein